MEAVGMEAVGPSDFVLYLERVVEPYTGMPLLGVSGFAPTPDWQLQVWYDEQLATETRTSTHMSAEHGYAFSTQLPWEQSERVKIVAIGAKSIILFDDAAAAIGARPVPCDTVNPTGFGRVRGFIDRTIRSILTGQVFSLRRWIARFDRAIEIGRIIALKVRHKRLSMRYPARPHYHGYIERTAITPDVERLLYERSAALKYRPKISILMPVYNVSPIWFRQAVASVVEQFYENWELCIADDCSTKAELHAEFSSLPDDPRIKLVRRSANGHICTATNSAADLATGEFIALLDHDDLLAKDALLEVVSHLQNQKNTDLIYTDEDKIDIEGQRYDPQFKPDWSPELLLSYNYINHFVVIRRKLFEELGRFRVGYEGSQDHDLLLRVTERTDRIAHIPRVLYHWRAHAESTAGRATQKTIVHSAGRRAIEDALRRRNIDCRLNVPSFAEKLGLPILELLGSDEGPSVAIVIYGSGAPATARAIADSTNYQNYTTYLVLDASNRAEALNRAAATRDEKLLVFLEAGVVPKDPRWLSQLVAYATIPGVSVVGPMIRSEEGSIRSAGTVLGMQDGTAPDHAFHGLDQNSISYYFYAETARNVAAVDRSCMLTWRKTFEDLGGFDCDRFTNALFDVDFCTRARLQGGRCVYVGSSVLQTDAMCARADDPVELLAFRKAYGRLTDPYGNPNFEESGAYRIAGAFKLQAFPPLVEPIDVMVATHNLNNPEGAPRYLSEIVLGLKDRNLIRPTIWSPNGGAGEMTYRQAQVPIRISQSAWGRRLIDGQWTRQEYLAAIRELKSTLKYVRPQLVMANTLLTFPMVDAAMELGIPTIWIIHESYSEDVLKRLYPAFVRARIANMFSIASRVVPASHDTAKLFAHYNSRGNVQVIHNGIPNTVDFGFARRVNAVKRIISVGTTCERKGQHTLIEAAARLKNTRCDFQVDIVGLRHGVPYAEYLQSMVKRYRLEGIVNLIPETNDVQSYYRSADIFVCTSHMETFSRSILEAEMYGLPIVSTSCHGVSEQVRWDYNALRFVANDASSLAAQLHRLLDDDKLRQAFRQNSRAQFENLLSVDEMLDRYESVVRFAIGRRCWEPTMPVIRQRLAA